MSEISVATPASMVLVPSAVVKSPFWKIER
jgi:hypothetical protein